MMDKPQNLAQAFGFEPIKGSDDSMSTRKSVEYLRDSLQEFVELFEEETDWDDTDALHDDIFEQVDYWFQKEFSCGSLSNLPDYPRNKHERTQLMNVCRLLELAETDAWISEDPGLWDGLKGQQVLYAQAFYSTENLFREYLSDSFMEATQ